MRSKALLTTIGAGLLMGSVLPAMADKSDQDKYFDKQQATTDGNGSGELLTAPSDPAGAAGRPATPSSSSGDAWFEKQRQKTDGGDR